MTEQAQDKAKKTETPAEVKPAKVRKKDTRPTNCAQSNKRIRRKDWFYRNGQYFASKKCFKLFVADQAKKKAEADEKAKKAAEEAAVKAPETPAAS
ncbi:MAG: hypothetical protein WCG06_02080 [Candidatus Omnitrophota bacterium]